MKTLTLIRHAKSSWKNPMLDDFDRPLNQRGKQDAPRMGTILREKGMTFDWAIASPAKRARSTAKRLCKALDYPEERIQWEERLYHADVPALLELVQACPEPHQRLALIGHNPGLHQFTFELTGTVLDNVVTTGVVEIELPIEIWKDTQLRQGTLKQYLYPKMFPST